MTPSITRRQATALLGAGLIAPSAALAQNALLSRAIPSSGERIPSVGLGTANVFGRGEEARQNAGAVIQALVTGGGRLIDTASTYGEAESVLGDVMTTGVLHDRIFIATKLEAPDPAELERSLSRLKTNKLDLLQLHNVRDNEQSLAQFKEWKAHGICRYFGITSTRRRDYPAVEAVLRREKPDFVQIDYSLDNCEAEDRILPLAAEVGAGVLTALPFGPRASVPKRAGDDPP